MKNYHHHHYCCYWHYHYCFEVSNIIEDIDKIIIIINTVVSVHSIFTLSHMLSVIDM